MTLRVLVVGDPYMPVSAYASALAGLDGRVELTTMQIAEVTCAPPVTESERGLREYVGDPAEVARAVAGHDVLVVHGAAVSAEVLGAACCGWSAAPAAGRSTWTWPRGGSSSAPKRPA